MENKIKITMNGQSFEIPVDTSLLTGLFGNMGPRMNQRPRMLGVPVPTSHERLQQSSHGRLEDNFFKLIDNETRTNIAVLALHKRLKVLEDKLGYGVPKHVEVPLGFKVGPNILAEFMKILKDSKPVVEKPKKEVKPKKQNKSSKPVTKKLIKK